jgi:hypothetical protein
LPAYQAFGVSSFGICVTRPARGSTKRGVPINYVSKILGHTNLSTTTRYLNIQRRGLHLAMAKLEESRKAAKQHGAVRQSSESESVVQALDKNADRAPAVGPGPDSVLSCKRLPS